MENGQDTSIPWMEETFPSESTSMPEIIENPSKVGTVVILVISAIILITLLFVIAIFIDCRQQKLETLEHEKKKKLIKIKIPKFGQPPRPDEECFADKMYVPSPSLPSSSNVIV